MSNLSKFEAFADDNSDVDKMTEFVCDRAGNIVEKEKMLVTSIFFFSHIVFKRLNFQDCKKSGLYGNEFNPFPTQRHPLMPLGNKPFENTMGKGEIARNEQFLVFPQCFLPFKITFCHFHQI